MSDDFQATLAALVELNIGIICCPSAALSMRQLRPIATPTYNRIARYWKCWLRESTSGWVRTIYAISLHPRARVTC